ncbi:hypothetical protein H1R82_07720 [Thermoactinomyces intermedius]|jgi:hypothetical protein|uniref:Uncharacterized protein n=1 Tax=Thermoactinomyces intermedius TaxID=2024 RepID=A0A8I1DDH3_THEIN|nr:MULTISPECIES: hypothetical protein [Thermoactinomyces]MBA4547875.1 hypothetical protein [Thermoactinomyces intermedius]MBA4836514.1 hypothetical protein [Thermoactinomyces intermedius]MBH8593894.1 hypothetical protein [Thermoactinomyces intermedius]MBH8599943.1 hypothetical protein [Thermoactinomyces sp. CICC 23799]
MKEEQMKQDKMKKPKARRDQEQTEFASEFFEDESTRKVMSAIQEAYSQAGPEEAEHTK